MRAPGSDGCILRLPTDYSLPSPKFDDNKEWQQQTVFLPSIFAVDEPNDPAEVNLNASKEWRDDANKALEKLGHGSQKKCAAAVGCSEPTLSQLLGGKITTSPFVGPISDWLKIPRPAQRALDPDSQEILDLFESATEEERKLIASFMRKIVRP